MGTAKRHFTLVTTGCVFLHAPEAFCAENTEAARSKILPQRSRDAFWDRTAAGMDVNIVRLTGHARNTLETSNVGLGFSFLQHIHTGFWGGLRIGLDSWKTTNQFASGAGETIFPIRITSDIVAEAPLWLLPGGDLLSFFRPFVSGGIGYLTFSSADTQKVQLLKALRGETLGFWGAGLRLSWNNSVAVNICVEEWKGLETSRFSGRSLFLGVQFGDLSRK